MLKTIGIVLLTLFGVWCYDHPSRVKSAWNTATHVVEAGASAAKHDLAK